MRFRIEYVPATIAHLKASAARQQSIVLDEVAGHLSVDPIIETRNRKLMRPNPLAPSELRLGSLRILRRRHRAGTRRWVLAVGVKERNAVRIGKAVIKL
jgi:hypothetical protein